MKAVRIPISGPVTVIDLTEPTDEDTSSFLAELYSTIGCESVECVRLSGLVDAWLDETGLIDRKPINQRATQIARAHGVEAGLPGVVVLVGADEPTGRSVGLTDDQIREVTRLLEISRTAGVRDEVAALAALGPFPREDGPDEDDHLFHAIEQRISAISRPVSIDEARVLVRLFPAIGDNCFGMAWTLLHLIESCPDWLSDEDLGTGPWADRMRQRQRNTLI